MKYQFSFLLILLIQASFVSSLAQDPLSRVKLVGQMKDVMWKGELKGKISLDTIADKQHLYGIGPVEYLSGEILIIDGKSYKSTVISQTAMRVEETFNLKAPFFGYAHIPAWQEIMLPPSIQTIEALEVYLDQQTKQAPRPFLFKLSGIAEEAIIHIVNLPQGATVRSPQDAHQGNVNYMISDQSVDIVGFFSTEHKTIFTHHDTFLHLHLITSDRQKMGHLDQVRLKSGSVKLYLPIEKITTRY
ncbi:acetolactate decarboxylase [Flavihumibacter sp. RY-1]|uniref:Acetolactate decarboxylase n=1 Tax=Flavihumibacter fluminis TaxID=2909236 RepID=A0ABS9BIY5_9BACT|nr:acetolactate decarboxylase [Flavihumibacter fluminis]MCF1715057.1 acetolactate decarboxylase [Flavihumibacter fluminis]